LKELKMHIEAFENGDTEYIFQVKMMVGASDKRGSSVTVGGLNFSILPYYDEECKKIYFRVELGIGLDGITLFSGFADKWSAVDWIIKIYLKGT
jgi:hypothetical protein